MSRIVSVWLKAWPIARLLRAQASGTPVDPIDPCRPLVLVAPGKGGARVVALNRAAQRGGLSVGDLLSNARSKVSGLRSVDADPAADAAALEKLALWALRYTPTAAAWDETSGCDGLFLDIAGCDHLFGGEEALLEDLFQRLRDFGLAPRLAIADTAGAAWALARHGQSVSVIVPPGCEAEVLRKLPLAGLRLSENAQSLLRRLGLRRIGELMDQPRGPLGARFDGGLLNRLDQALGRRPEPLTPVVPPPVYHARAMFIEPIASAEHVMVAAERLLHELAQTLTVDDAGARVLRLLLFRVDGGTVSLDLGLAAPTRDVQHMVRLFALRLERLQNGLESGFGFEAAAIHVSVAEALAPRQSGLMMGEEGAAPDGLARLIDRVQQRLGPGAVIRLDPRQSHIPECAEQNVDAGAEAVPREPAGAAVANVPVAPRPILLLPEPETVQAVAVIPDGPPRQFRWRGVMHQVTAAEGPERITPEWWQRRGAAERDYYVVEDTEGRRFWLYRDGLYGSGAALPKWFVHGVFA
jgi:protein ImuB